MIPAAALRKMLDMGLTLEQACELADVWEAASPKADSSLSKAAARTRRWREKRHGDVTVTRHGDVTQRKSPEPPKKNTPFPPLKGGTSPTDLVQPRPEKPTAEPAKPLSVWVGEIWEITPTPARRRSGKRDLENALKAAIRRGADPAAIKAGLIGYYASPDATKDEGRFAKGADSAISSGRWEAFAEDDPGPPDHDPDPWPRRLLTWQTAQYWNSEWGPKPDRPGYLGPQADAAAKPQAKAA